MGKGMVTAGKLAADALKEMGVDMVFFIAGGHTYPVQEGLAKNGIRMFSTRHEQAAVFMAEAPRHNPHGEKGLRVPQAGADNGIRGHGVPHVHHRPAGPGLSRASRRCHQRHG